MLVTSSQLSVAISSTIIFIFTSLLFVSGYILQQRSVASLQAALLSPPSPSPTPTTPPAYTPLTLPTYPPPPPRTHQVPLTPTTSPAVAHVQLVTSHVLLCNAIMIFAALARTKSPAARVLLYPKLWDVLPVHEDMANPALATTRRLLRLAQEELGVILRPLQPFGGGDGADFLPSSYPQALLFGLTEYEAVLHLPPSGLLLNAAPLDALLARVHNEQLPFPLTASASLLLLRPSAALYSALVNKLGALPRSSNPSLSALVYNARHAPPLPPTPGVPIFCTADLSDPLGERVDVRTLVGQVGYVRVAERGLPGPEFDFGVGRMGEGGQVAGDEDARRFRELVLDRYREDRRGVCGLDLEPWGG
ncbi:MAG: hypothetical protein M1829_006645 [Trizodia sp. TS-e1964]|nr:MAG: hypothetical protein M1829_006645 [Trizodia sp. TS-e1964]